MENLNQHKLKLFIIQKSTILIRMYIIWLEGMSGVGRWIRPHPLSLLLYNEINTVCTFEDVLTVSLYSDCMIIEREVGFYELYSIVK